MLTLRSSVESDVSDDERQTSHQKPVAAPADDFVAGSAGDPSQVQEPPSLTLGLDSEVVTSEHNGDTLPLKPEPEDDRGQRVDDGADAEPEHDAPPLQGAELVIPKRDAKGRFLPGTPSPNPRGKAAGQTSPLAALRRKMAEQVGEDRTRLDAFLDSVIESAMRGSVGDRLALLRLLIPDSVAARAAEAKSTDLVDKLHAAGDRLQQHLADRELGRPVDSGAEMPPGGVEPSTLPAMDTHEGDADFDPDRRQRELDEHIREAAASGEVDASPEELAERREKERVERWQRKFRRADQPPRDWDVDTPDNETADLRQHRDRMAYFTDYDAGEAAIKRYDDRRQRKPRTARLD